MEHDLMKILVLGRQFLKRRAEYYCRCNSRVESWEEQLQSLSHFILRTRNNYSSWALLSHTRISPFIAAQHWHNLSTATSTESPQNKVKKWETKTVGIEASVASEVIRGQSSQIIFDVSWGHWRSSWGPIWLKIEKFINEFWPQWPLRSLEAKVNKYFIRSFEVILKSDMVTRWRCYHCFGLCGLWGH